MFHPLINIWPNILTHRNTLPAKHHSFLFSFVVHFYIKQMSEIMQVYLTVSGLFQYIWYFSMPSIMLLVTELESVLCLNDTRFYKHSSFSFLYYLYRLYTLVVKYNTAVEMITFISWVFWFYFLLICIT